MKNYKTFLAISCILLTAAGVAAQELKLIPEPRQIERKNGVFTIGATTRIVVGAAHAREDRLAAQTIADDVQNLTGKKILIVAGPMPPGEGAIYLARTTDDRSLNARLKTNNLTIDDAFDDEGYVLDANASRIIIGARTGAGVFYGAQTLRQLLLPIDSKRLSVPAVAIRDWPAMRWRGVHDDLSRGPVSTMDYMKKQVRTLAEYKLNLFALYMEHVFDYKSQPLIAPKEGSLDGAQVKELVEYAQRYHVTILPEQQAFGHLHHVLKYEMYSDLAETPHGHVLAPGRPGSYDLIKSFYSELAPLFPGPLFHIGSDETFELGQGQTKQRAAEIGLGRVYLEHLQKVSEIMQPYHKRLMFWGDIAIRYPELLGVLPKDMIANAWSYGPSPDFTKQIKPFRDAGLDVFVSPGANNWVHIWPNFDAAFVNVRNFVRDGQKLGAIGMLNTTWDDDGEALFGMTWPALVLGADCSWQAGECSIERFLNNYDWAFYRNTDNTFRDAILDLNRTSQLLRQAGLNAALNEHFWSDPFTETGARFTGRALPVAHDFRLAAERALQSLYRNREKARLHADTLDYMVFAGMRLDLLGMKVQFADEMNSYYRDAFANQQDRARVRRDMGQIAATNGRLEDLRDATTRIRGYYSDLWLKENHAYWLGNVQIRYDRMAGIYEEKIQAVKRAGQQFGFSGALPAPESLGFFTPPPPPPPGAATPPAVTPPPAEQAPGGVPPVVAAPQTPAPVSPQQPQPKPPQ